MVCYPDVPFPASFTHTIHHYKVVLFPVGDARERNLGEKLVEGDFNSQRLVPDRFCSVTDPEHRYAIPCDMAFLPQVVKGELFPVIPGDHPQAGGTTVGRIMLAIYGKPF